MTTGRGNSEPYAEDTVLTELFGDDPKVKIVAALLGESDRDVSVAEIAELAGVHRTTVYDHIGDLVELGVVEETRTVSGGQLYRIDRDGTVAEDVAQLEWDLLDVIAEPEE